VKFLPYVLKHLRHSWIRTGSTVVAMSVCIFLFCTLQTLLAAIQWSLNSANASRLVSRNAISLVYNLPPAYRERIKGIPGVKQVAASNWFGGFLGATPDYKNFFPNFAVDPEPYFEVHPEFQVPPDQKAAFLGDRRSAIIGPDLAKKYSWKVGDQFQLTSVIWRIPFEFVVAGIYEVDKVRNPGVSGQFMFFHWKYLDEATKGRSAVGTYQILIADPAKAGSISKEIDALFENSDRQTKTETEAAFFASFASMSGNLAVLLNGIALAVAFTILLVTANTMSMAVRERRNEIGVLKTLGFGSRLVMGLVLVESLVLGVLGGALGLALGSLMIQVLPSLPQIGAAVAQFPNLRLMPQVAALGFSLSIFIGLASGFVPALIAFRSKITDSLRAV
jgi:putative ABC transport system permease protein